MGVVRITNVLKMVESSTVEQDSSEELVPLR